MLLCFCQLKYVSVNKSNKIKDNRMIILYAVPLSLSGLCWAGKTDIFIITIMTVELNKIQNNINTKGGTSDSFSCV